MSTSGNYPFRQKSKRSKVVLFCVLGSVLFLGTLAPVLNIPILSSSSSFSFSSLSSSSSSPFLLMFPPVAASSTGPPPPGGQLLEGVPDQTNATTFQLVEATIDDIHQAIRTNQTSCQEIVQTYIDRARAYNGVCTQLVTEDGAPIPPTTGAVRAGAPLEFPTETVPVSEVLPNFTEYEGLPIEFGRMETTASDPSVQQQFGMVVGIPNAGQLDALGTLNIRGERSVTCKGEYDAHPSTGPLPEGAPPACEEFRQQPDALERAAELDAQYGSNPPLDELPMYCIPFSIKDVFDTKDMRSTGGADINYAMDVPPFDATSVAELRAKGAIVYAKTANIEWNFGIGDPGGPNTSETNYLGNSRRSTWAGGACNPYDTERDFRGTSSGSGSSVAANLVVFSLCEQTAGSCKGPASRMAAVNLLATKGIMPDAGGTGSQFITDRVGITARTVEDAVLVLDAVKNPERGYFDPRDIYTALPKALIPEEPYASFVIGDEDLQNNSRPLEGMRIGVVSEFFVKHALNDVAISDQIDNEVKTILRDNLGAELVESVDPLYPDDPEIPNMEYTFQDALAEILPRHMPEYFNKTEDGELEFAVPGYDVRTLDYLVQLSEGLAPLSDDLNIRRVKEDFPPTFNRVLDTEQYLIKRGDERIKNMESLVDNSKFYIESDRVGAQNWKHFVENVSDIRSEGLAERMKMSYVMGLVVLKVMHENNIDAFVNPENTIPHPKFGGPTEPTINDRGSAGSTQWFTALIGIPEIIVPAGYNQIVYEPMFELNENNTEYNDVSGTEQSLLDTPLPISIMFWAGPGDEPTLMTVASAYEAATHHRTPPPDFGPLSGEP